MIELEESPENGPKGCFLLTLVHAYISAFQLFLKQGLMEKFFVLFCFKKKKVT